MIQLSMPAAIAAAFTSSAAFFPEDFAASAAEILIYLIS